MERRSEMSEKVPGLMNRVEDVVAVMEREREDARTGGPRDRRICLCGHPLARHTEVRGATICKPSRMECRCRNMVAALTVSDTRSFLRKTTGVGDEHALVKGLTAAIAAGQEFIWLIETVCSSCGSDEVTAVGLRRTGGEAGVTVCHGGESPEATRLLCAGCTEAVE